MSYLATYIDLGVGLFSFFCLVLAVVLLGGHRLGLFDNRRPPRGGPQL